MARQRRGTIAVNAARHLGIHHDLAAGRRQQLHVRIDGFLFLLDRTLQQARAVPARHQCQAVLGQDRTKDIGLAGELVAELDPVVARLLRFGQTGLQRRFAAELRHVVVGPGQRIDADTNGH